MTPEEIRTRCHEAQRIHPQGFVLLPAVSVLALLTRLDDLGAALRRGFDEYEHLNDE